MHSATDKIISLFVPFYTPKDEARAAELLKCLRHNLDCAAIDHVYLLQDDNTARPYPDDHLTVLKLPRRPTYLDWVRYSQELCPDHISVLANSDIYVDDDIAQLTEIFATNETSFVALSRYDQIRGDIQPHPNPHWSQDTWAFLPALPVSSVMAHQLNIPLGVPRCDNKVAYVFSINGYTVVNPFHHIRSIHVHETGLRYYDKTGDTRIKGGMAMVHPSETLTSPAPLDLEIWSLNTKSYTAPRINRSLERWRDERESKAQITRRIFSYDSDWQYPAITEQHAFARMNACAQQGQALPEGSAYLGFPWATLIDLSTHARHRADKITILKTALAQLAEAMAPYDRVITVCQHIRLQQHVALLAEAGVTDIFWSHCRSDLQQLPEHPEIALHPFPLFPVQQAPVVFAERHSPRPVLFSFVGARASDIYMTNSRNQIIDLLSDSPAGHIIDRSSWHYNKVVYDKQILNRTSDSASLEDQDAASQFRDLLRRSLFTLCPSGTGPNSIRLWEAAHAGSIPVVLSDRYMPPRDIALWEMATVTCPETTESIVALPDQLHSLQEDQTALARKQTALYLLAQKYGPKNFVHDIFSLT